MGLLEATCLVFATTFVVTTVIVAMAGPAVQGRTSPAHRHGRAMAWLYAPIWVPSLVTLATIAPGTAAMLLGASDHCLAHASHHHHLCPLHPPHPSDAWVGWSGIVVLTTVALGRMAREWHRIRRGHALASALISLAAPSRLGNDVVVVEDERPMAFVAGALRPRVVVSAGLLAGATPTTIEAVLAHERAHMSRRHTLRQACDRLAAALLPKRAATALLSELVLAREQTCDREAAEVAGGPASVIAALREVLLLGLTPSPLGPSAAAGDVEERVRELCEPSEPPRLWRARYAVCVGILAGLAAGPLHAAFEHALTAALH